MCFAIVCTEVEKISGTAAKFNINSVLSGLLLKTDSGKYKAMLEEEYNFGTYDNIQNAVDALSDLYILLADVETRYRLKELKSCLKKFSGVDLRYLL